MKALLETVQDILGDVLRPLRVLVVAMLGVGVAMLWLHGAYGAIVFIVVAAIMVSLICDSIGQDLLPAHPRWALFFMEFWVLAPATVAASAAGLVVVVGIALSPPKGTADDVTAVVTAISTALTAFIAAFVSWVGEKDDSRIADRIKRNFRKFYGRPAHPPVPRIKYFAPESRGERALYSERYAGVDGWGLEARWGRAKIIAEELVSGRSDPLPPPP
jgi:hypothetical protein